MSETLSREQIERIEGLAKKATPGPWENVENTYETDLDHAGSKVIGYQTGRGPSTQISSRAGCGVPIWVSDDFREIDDANFVVALVNAWPTLRDRIAQLERELGECRAKRERTKELWLKEAKPEIDQLAARASAAEQDALPEGYVAAPKEPTEAMVQNACVQLDKQRCYVVRRGYINDEDVRIAYGAMLAAAPEPK